MNSTNFKHTKIAASIAMLVGAAYSPIAFSEEAVEEEKTEVIEVTGIRGSLMRSMNVKRDMSGVVDAISAEEMGKFPDTNLAESLQRITGVTVSRSNGEGSEITVRGFGPDFNLVTLNGRQMPGTGNSRSFKFENLASDGVSALEVYKTARAENPTGGLGATVNIVTTKPLQSPGEKLSVSAKAINDTSNVAGDDVTPELSALYSNTFADDSFGVAFAVNSHRRDFQQQSATVAGWQANVGVPGDLDPANVIDPRPLDDEGDRVGNIFFPRNLNYSFNDVQRERTNGYVIFQYAPIEEIIIGLDYTASNSVTGSNSIGWGQWHDYGGNINGYEIDANGTVLYADLAGNDGSFSANRDTTEVDSKSVGLNVEWQASESLFLTLDYHDSSSETDNGKDKGLGGTGALTLGSDQLVTKTYDYRTGEVPHGEIFWKNGTNELAPGEIDSHFSQFLHGKGKSEIEQLQLDAVWENYTYDIGLVDVKFGLGRTEQTMSGSNAWSGLIGGFLFSPSYTELFPDNMFTRNSTAGFLDAFDGGGSDLSPHYYYTFDFDEVVTRSEAFLTNEELGGTDSFSTSAYRGDDGMGSFSSGSVQEDTTSVYLNTAWEFEFSNVSLQVNAGIRYEETDVTSKVAQPVPTAVWWKGGSEFLTQYATGDNSILTVTGEHDVLLPMLDLRLDITDDLVGRISWGKTIARAPLGNLAGALSLSGSPKVGSRNGGEGNTNLQPYESTNLDLSLEYYYGEGSYASVGYFKKDVKNFIGTEIYQTTAPSGIELQDIYLGPRWLQAEADLGGTATNDEIFAQIIANGSALNDSGFLVPEAGDPLIEWDITRPFNASDIKTVDGFEVALQHLIGETGFGFGINATVVDGDVTFDVDSLENQTPLTGLSDSANLQAFYEKDGLSVKVTYAWRDEYLIGVGQSQGSSDNPPQFGKEFGQWDMSVNYDIDERITVFFEGINLNNETEQGFGRYEEQFLFARQYGPRYGLGVRYSFN